MILPSKATQNNPVYMARTKRRENIFLVADDDMFMRTTIKGIMSAKGSVFEATNGSEVDKAYHSLNPDVVFLDIHLPEKNGQEILQSLLAMDPDAYVVMVSSDSSRDNVQTTLKKGARDFLTKPFTRERIMECLKQCSTIY
jgi:two-component system chemotaxis response regulator CheY